LVITAINLTALPVLTVFNSIIFPFLKKFSGRFSN
jgi:hypothetical protein